MKLLFVSTSVGPLGTGLGGGVELTLYNIAQQMIQRGHEVQIVAPAGSTWDNLPLVQIPGNLQIIAQSQERTDPVIMPENSVLANMWDYARQVQADYDLMHDSLMLVSAILDDQDTLRFFHALYQDSMVTMDFRHGTGDMATYAIMDVPATLTLAEYQAAYLKILEMRQHTRFHLAPVVADMQSEDMIPMGRTTPWLDANGNIQVIPTMHM